MAVVRENQTVKLHSWQRPRKCALCRTSFEPTVAWHRFCGSLCRDAGSRMRKSIALAEWICIYCGEVGDSIDHVPPSSVRPNIVALGLTDDYPFLEVRACRECNSALSVEGGWTIRERKRHIKRWLMRRYARLLSMPDWEAEEILELGPGLSAYVSSGVVKKSIIERRLKF